MRFAILNTRPNTRLTWLIACGVLAQHASAGVDPALLALVPPDAKMLVGIQVERTQGSPFGKYLLSQVKLDASTRQTMAAAGFDLSHDLREILAASGDGLSGLLLGRGSFQQAKLSKAALTAGAAKSMYRGVEVLRLDAGAKDQVAGSLAFLDATTLAAGDADAVKAVLDRRAAGKPFSGPLFDRAREISSVTDAWLVSVTLPPALTGGAQSPGAAQNPQLGSFQNLFQSALQLSAGVKFTATQVALSVEVLTRSAQDAQSMADLVKFFVGMVPANGGSSKANGSQASGSNLGSIAEAARISTSGQVVNLALSVPEEQMEQLFMSGRGSFPNRATPPSH
jgi:hypothetical protein